MTGAPGWETAERSGADAVGPGTDWDPLVTRELAEDAPAAAVDLAHLELDPPGQP